MPAKSASSIAPIFASLCAGREVLVLGSAPSANLRSMKTADILIAVNGSLAPFPHAQADILVINGYTAAAKTKLTTASMSGLIGRHVRHVVGITRGLPWDQLLVRLADASVTFETSEAVSPAQRRRLTEMGLGRPVASEGGEDVCSTGVAALVMASRSDARKVRTSGFSYDGGHSYVRWPTVRGHLEVDRAICRRLGFRVT